jgi:fucose permease
VLVSFPASGVVLTQTYGLSDQQYGTLFVFQLIAALSGAVVAALYADRTTLQRWLQAAILTALLAECCLAAVASIDERAAFAVAAAGISFLGVSFGIGAAPLNSLPKLLFPAQPHSAVVALHTLLGLGLACGPLLLGAFIMAGQWSGFPLLLAVVGMVLLAGSLAIRLPGASQTPAPGGVGHLMRQPLFWLYVVAAILYAFAEGTFANWASIYVDDVRDLGAVAGALSLSIFWAAMVTGRLLVSALLVWVSPWRIWPLLPLIIAAAFPALARIETIAEAYAAYAVAGLACSAFFPLSMTLASERFAQGIAQVSSLMIAALMCGVGLGSYVIGLLRQQFGLERLFDLSVIYPLAALVIVLVIASLQRQSR